MKAARRLYYLGLEPLAARYTKQLCEQWFPDAVKAVSPDTQFISVDGMKVDTEIKVGAVLDATGRGIYSCAQVASLLNWIRSGAVTDDDVIFLQDFWTPGFEAVLYALDLHGVRPKIYSMLHAQSVDEYDFTWDMRRWMRPIELGLAKAHTAIFVGSTVHREQLRAAGFDCPIHVVGLPISVGAVRADMGLVGKRPLEEEERRRNVVFSSRLDREKNPDFMLAVAQEFLRQNPQWTWTVTTSGAQFRSNVPGLVERLQSFEKSEPRFILRAGLTKAQYYEELTGSVCQFNCSLQDYVSWTLLEAAVAGCRLVYPQFRSFPEILPASMLYHAFSQDAAVDHLNRVAAGFGYSDWAGDFDPTTVARLCDHGRILEAQIVCGLKDPTKELNIWHSCFL